MEMPNMEMPNLDALDEARERTGNRRMNDPADRSLPDPRSWPEPPAPEAYVGLAGDIVRAIEPHTEADPVALLAHVLIGFGSMIGRKAYYVVEATTHYANEFVVLVGRTAKGRKGTAEDRIRAILRTVDPEWDRDHVVDGLSSGEGIIWAVRDPIEKVDGNGEREVVDGGVKDKRLLAITPEFASVLRVLLREGNTLSPVLRKAWDSGSLRTLTKNSPARATDAHISVIAHITEEELRRYLDRTEAANGYGNRHLYLCVRRARELPFGGEVIASSGALSAHLSAAVLHGRRTEQVTMETPARQAWERVYSALSREREGLLGAVTGRAEAHVIRLALIYALLDCAMSIGVKHLFAALAVWRYAEDSARYIFGTAIGDPIAEEILFNLQRSPGGMTRTEIWAALGRHGTQTRLETALGGLRRNGKVRSETEATAGRSAERWCAT
jgi:hypothetical protein